MKAFITDLDGTLTDGGYYISDCQGEHTGSIDGFTKKFNTRDFHGLQLLRYKGLMVAVVSSDNSSVTQMQFKRAAPFALVMTGVKNKMSVVEKEIVEARDIDWSEICFIGDDVNDLELLGKVGLAACPADAEDDVRDAVFANPNGYVMSRKGGEGCVREFVNMIIKNHIVYNKPGDINAASEQNTD